MQQSGKYVIIIGAFLFIVGIIIYFFGNRFHWLGNLPGDIRIEKENFRLYFPFTTMIIISLLLTIIIHFLRKFL